MNKHNTLCIVLAISAVIIVPIVWISVNNWGIVKNSFFTYTLMDLTNVILTILFGIVISVYFSLINNNYLKKAEILFGNMDSLIELFKDIKISFENDEDNILTTQKQSYYKKIFRDTSKEISNIEFYIKLCFKSSGKLEECMKILKDHTRNMKTVITDKPFEKGYKIVKNDIYLSNDKYFNIKACINKMKMLMFS